MANNSSGARSVLYGKTIDHVLEQEVVLSDGSVAHFRPLDARRARRGLRRRHARGRAATARSGGSRATHAGEIERRFPKVLRRVGGYNLDAFVDPAQPFNLAKLMVGSEGTLGVVARGEDRPRAAAEGQGGAGDPVRRPARGARRDAGDPRAPAVGGRGDGRLHPRPHEAERRARRAAPHVHRGRSRRAAVRRVLRRSRGGPAAAARGARARPARARGFGYRYHRALDLPAQARDLEPARGGARPVDGDEGRRQVDVVRRGHGGRAREAARLHRAVPRDRPARTARPPASTRTRRSAACTCGRSST